MPLHRNLWGGGGEYEAVVENVVHGPLVEVGRRRFRKEQRLEFCTSLGAVGMQVSPT